MTAPDITPTPTPPQPTDGQQPVAQQPIEPAPDFSRLNRAGELMRRLANVGPSQSGYNEAQTLFEAARQEYLKEAQKHHDFFQQIAKNQAVEPADLGVMASARIGAAQGLGGLGGGLAGAATGAALGSVIPGPGTAIGGALGGLAGAFGGSAAVKPLAELFSSAPAEDVRRQWAATVGEHPDAALAGEIGASAFGTAALITANKLVTGMKLAGARLAQTQIRTKIMSQKLLALESKLTAAAQAGVPAEETTIRSYLAKQGYPPEAIESVIQSGQAKGILGGIAKQAARSAAGAGVADAAATTGMRAGESFNPMPGSPKGFEVTGTRATPPVPTTPTITEIQDQLAGQRSRFAQRGFSATPGEVPQPAGGVTLTPRGGTPSGPPSPPLFASSNAPPISTLEQIKRARILRQAGFSAADAEELAQKGTAVTREALEKAMGKRLPGAQKWQ